MLAEKPPITTVTVGNQTIYREPARQTDTGVRADCTHTFIMRYPGVQKQPQCEVFVLYDYILYDWHEARFTCIFLVATEVNHVVLLSDETFQSVCEFVFLEHCLLQAGHRKKTVALFFHSSCSNKTASYILIQTYKELNSIHRAQRLNLFILQANKLQGGRHLESVCACVQDSTQSGQHSNGALLWEKLQHNSRKINGTVWVSVGVHVSVLLYVLSLSSEWAQSPSCLIHTETHSPSTPAL